MTEYEEQVIYLLGVLVEVSFMVGGFVVVLIGLTIARLFCMRIIPVIMLCLFVSSASAELFPGDPVSITGTVEVDPVEITGSVLVDQGAKGSERWVVFNEDQVEGTTESDQSVFKDGTGSDAESVFKGAYPLLGGPYRSVFRNPELSGAFDDIDSIGVFSGYGNRGVFHDEQYINPIEVLAGSVFSIPKPDNGHTLQKSVFKYATEEDPNQKYSIADIFGSVWITNRITQVTGYEYGNPEWDNIGDFQPGHSLKVEFDTNGWSIGYIDTWRTNVLINVDSSPTNAEVIDVFAQGVGQVHTIPGAPTAVFSVVSSVTNVANIIDADMENVQAEVTGGSGLATKIASMVGLTMPTIAPDPILNIPNPVGTITSSGGPPIIIDLSQLLPPPLDGFLRGIAYILLYLGFFKFVTYWLMFAFVS